MISTRLSSVKKRIYYRHGLIYTTAKGTKHLILKSVERLTSMLATNIINVSTSLSEVALKHKLNKSKKQSVISKGTCGGIEALKDFNQDSVGDSVKENLKRSLGIGPKISWSDFAAGSVSIRESRNYWMDSDFLGILIRSLNRGCCW